MHTDGWNSSEFLIELPQVEFNPIEFLKEIGQSEMGHADRYEYAAYLNAYNKPTSQEISYHGGLIETAIVKHYLDIFKDFNIQLGTPENNHDYGTGLNGWSLIRSKRGASLPKHRDAKRPTCITFPLTFPQRVNFWESKESTEPYVYEYKPVIILMNAGTKWHSTDPVDQPRIQFQLDCYNTWDEMKELAKTL